MFFNHMRNFTIITMIVWKIAPCLAHPPEIELARITPYSSEIELTRISPKTNKYVKSATLLFCRILDQQFNINPSSITSLERLKNLDENVRQINPFCNTLVTTSARVLIEYNARIRPDEHYLRKARYYNALKWLELQIGSNKTIQKAIKVVFQQGKPRNYIYEIIPKPLLENFINLADEELKTLKGWLTMDDQYNKAAYFMMEIAQGKHGGQREELSAALSVNTSSTCTDVKIYEEIIASAEPSLFRPLFDKEPVKMMRLVYQAIDTQSKQYNNIVSPLVDAIAIQKINLLDLQKNVISYLKHATILFVHAIEQTYSKFLPDHEREELEKYPTLYSEYPDSAIASQSTRNFESTVDTLVFTARYCTIQSLINDIAIHLKNSLESKVIRPTTFEGKAYLKRLLSWFDDVSKFESNRYENCKKRIEQRTEILTFVPKVLVHILQEVGAMGCKRRIFTPEGTFPSTVEELKEYGKNDDDAVSTMMAVATLDLWAEGQELYFNLLPTATEDQLEEYKNRMKTVEDTIKRLAVFGTLDYRIKCRDFRIYRRLLNDMGGQMFLFIFGKSPAQMMGRIQKILQDPRNDELVNLSKQLGIVKAPNSRIESIGVGDVDDEGMTADQ